VTHSFASRFDECFFGLAVLDEDGFGTCRPCEGLRVLVSMLDPFSDRPLELGNIAEGSSPYTLSNDFGEQTFDQVEPGAGCRREVQLEALMSRQPVLHGRCFVSGVIIEDELQIEMGGVFRSIFLRKARNSSALRRGTHSPITVPVAISSAAKSVVVPLRL
jgi:hypothetical protein